MSTSDIIPGLSPQLSQRLILEAMELLQRRSLIDQAARTPMKKPASRFYSAPVLVEYLSEPLIAENFPINQRILSEYGDIN